MTAFADLCPRKVDAMSSRTVVIAVVSSRTDLDDDVDVVDVTSYSALDVVEIVVIAVVVVVGARRS